MTQNNHSSFRSFWQELHTLDKDNLGQASPMAKGLVVLMMVIIIAMIAHLVIINPSRQKLMALQSTQQSLLTEYQEKYLIARNLPAYQERQLQQNNRLQGQILALPRTAQMSLFVERINQAAQAHQVTVLTTSIRPMLQQTYYTQRPVQVTTQGSYHQLGRWLHELMTTIQPLGIDDLKLTAQDGRLVNISILLSTYQAPKEISLPTSDEGQ
ncbi:type 4a pilus biogenesis protein PilO [Moraxella nasicaprae]|uniref:Type 4a pilus biogenesis protein PilO n=1 Tax=Moraxella nasicaprae TaxID=2904122 RepID=A0ABY6F306_9GAMM|nr:type 4a pilus biogenesis protein PilO [Moraxella nasicaprae]UXZ04455.1 type 4a pilus biogenesis protein PilO [Moraxella nasicaprae]